MSGIVTFLKVVSFTKTLNYDLKYSILGTFSKSSRQNSVNLREPEEKTRAGTNADNLQICQIHRNLRKNFYWKKHRFIPKVEHFGAFLQRKTAKKMIIADLEENIDQQQLQRVILIVPIWKTFLRAFFTFTQINFNPKIACFSSIFGSFFPLHLISNFRYAFLHDGLFLTTVFKIFHYANKPRKIFLLSTT